MDSRANFVGQLVEHERCEGARGENLVALKLLTEDAIVHARRRTPSAMRITNIDNTHTSRRHP
jgi:hypothetical protein